jgi:DNA (cytosine-5)-methyltransferase 1
MTRLRAVDLFAGAGGLSKGFEEAGAEVVMAVESSPKAAQTYRANHQGVVLEESINEGWNVVERLEESLKDPRCDLLIGGPPCQGWSTIGGRGNDARRALFNACIDHFLTQVELLLPPAVVMENVRGLALRESGKHLQKVVERLEELGYRVSVHDVSAADFGIPQLRHRIFVVAVLRELGVKYELRQSHRPSEWVTVWEAIGDLPSLTAGQKATEYSVDPTNDFQRSMRRGQEELTWHVAPKHSERMLEILRALPQEGASRAELGNRVALTSGFHNTYCRLWSTRPAPAITSSAGRISSGRNAHPFDDRALTPREAARLQTFPDNYTWEGERWPVYQQIGNAVPPKLAKAVAAPLLERLAPMLLGCST